MPVFLKGNSPDLSLQSLRLCNTILSTVFNRCTSFEFTEGAGNIAEVTESDFVSQVYVWTARGTEQIGQMLHPDAEQILVHGHARSLLETHFHASSGHRNEV